MNANRARYELRLGFGLEEGQHGVIRIPGRVPIVLTEAEIDRICKGWRGPDEVISQIIAEREVETA